MLEDAIMRPSAIGLMLTLALVIFTAPLTPQAQHAAHVSRLGLLMPGSASGYVSRLEAFRHGLRDLGYVEGQNLILESRYTEGRFERLPELAAELVQLPVDVLVTAGSQPVQVLQHATRTIPIVGVALADPVETGFAVSLARPGGNITGLAFQNADLSTKRLALLKEVMPGITRVAILWDSHNPASAHAVRVTEEAGQSLGLQMHRVEVRGPDDFASALAAATQEGAQALIQVGSPLFNTHRQTLLDLVATHRLPATCEQRAFVAEGCLMAYGPSFSAMWYRAATYVDKILKGAKPADLPLEQPMQFELVINLKTAETLGLSILPSILFQADEVIR
jgi:putative ABC transport system substrate-binding protein